MDLKFEVAGRINKPVEDVFEAVADPDKLSGYFTTGGAKGRLETGVIVYWDFHDFPGEFPVEIIEVEQNKRIVFKWESTDNHPETGKPYFTLVTMRFEALDGDRTLVSIAEEGWVQSIEGRDASYNSCMGWSQMLCALKAYLEYGINLREGMYK